MKKLSAITLLLFWILVSQAQKNNVIWSEWNTVYQEQPNLKVEVSFKLYPCKNGAITGSFASYYRIRSNFQRPKAYCNFSFDFVNCDGQVKSETIKYPMEKPEVKEWNQGQWFPGYRINRIRLIKIEDYNVKTVAKNEVPATQNTVATQSVPVKSNPPLSIGNSTNGTSNRGSGTGAAGNNTGSTSSNSSSGQTRAIMNNLNRQLANNQQTYNSVASGLQQLGNIFQENAARKAAERDAAEERREEKERVEKEKREEDNRIEAERQAEIAENNRIRAAAAKREMDRQWNIDVQVLGNYLVRKKTSEIPDNIKQVYYIIYQRNYQTNQVTLKTYSLNKYSDDTWMLQADLLNKVQFIPYISTGGVGQFLGFYSSKAQAQEAINQIKTKVAAVTVDSSFLLLNGGAQQGTVDKGFWNN